MTTSAAAAAAMAPLPPQQPLFRDIAIAIEGPSASPDSKDLTASSQQANAIRTTKFTWYNWLPKSIFQQFRRVANAYFLGISILMILGSYATYLFQSPLDPYSTILTLLVILLITSCKEGYEDLQRRKSDQFENNREVTVLSFEGGAAPKETKTRSKHLKPGDIVKLEGTVPAPADLLLVLTSMHSDGNKCYVETANIDGETNLKLREAPSLLLSNELGHLVSAGRPVPELFRGTIQAEEPNANIHKFVGTLQLQSCQHAIPIDSQNILLRSALFSNTDWAYGIVVYAGQETKIQLNSLDAPSKMSKLEENLNTAIIIIFIAQISLVTMSVISIYALGYQYKHDFPYVYPSHDSSSLSILPLWLEMWFVFFLLYNNFIPLSLYVTIEIVNLGQALLISSDTQLYHPGLDVACTVRASNLVQELGMVSNVFSDKTGTLTRNEMKLVKYVIKGRIYDMPPCEPSSIALDMEDSLSTATDSGFGSSSSSSSPTKSPGGDVKKVFTRPKVVRDDTPASSPPSSASSPTLVAILNEQQQQRKAPPDSDLHSFLRCLMTCHTVVRESNGTYRAESPDELALVEGATNSFNCQLLERGSREMKMTIQGAPHTFMIHAVNPFNADRKRMSLLLSDKSTGKYIVVCKGADNIMLPLCQTSEHEQAGITSTLLKLSNMGLRTLIVAQKYLSNEDAERWLKEYKSAQLSTSNRDDAIATAGAALEKGMTVVGVTAIEDRLQDEVPEVIADLAKAGIIVWMLTGDKLETAVNIGYSCNLLVPNMNIIMISGVDKFEDFASLLKKEYDLLLLSGAEQTNRSSSSSETSPPSFPLLRSTALVLDGPSFSFFNKADEEQCHQLLVIGRHCRSVIACRLTPLQKRELVALVKNDKNARPAATTLSIGDGANDVSMILEANVGVGIFGKEGRQAANNADFAIGEFKFLRRLLLVHGRWNYVRQSTVFLYCMHKNMVITMTLFWYSYFSAVSGCSMYESWIYSGFNFILGLPIIFFGIMDKDISAEFACSHPQVYSTGRTNALLNVPSILQWIVNAMLYTVVVCLIYYYCIYVSFYDTGLYVAGTSIMVGLILSLQYKVMFFHHQWARPHVYAMLFSVFGMFLYYLLIEAAVPDFAGEAMNMYSLGVFWLMSVFTVPIAAIHIDWLYHFIRYFFCPTNEMLFREMELKDKFDACNRLACISGDDSSSGPRDSDTLTPSSPILHKNSPLKIKPNPAAAAPDIEMTRL